MQWIREHFSFDDLWSAIGYVALFALSRVANPGIEPAVASVLASGMLAIFWGASKNVRERNAEREPNARVVFWAAVALGSLGAYFLG